MKPLLAPQRDFSSVRHDAQVKPALKNGPFALIILGSAHDLPASVKRLPGGNCEYLRGTTTRYQEVGANGPK